MRISPGSPSSASPPSSSTSRTSTPGNGSPHRPGLGRPTDQRRRDPGCGLGQAVALEDGKARRRRDLLEDRRRHRRSTGEEHADGGERLAQAGARAPRHEHRRGPGDVGHAVAADHLEGRVRVEALDQHGRGRLVGDRRERAVEAVDVEERQDEQHHVVGPDARRLDRGDVVDVREQRPVGEHRALRAAARAGGEEQQRQALGVGDHGRRRAPDHDHRGVRLRTGRCVSHDDEREAPGPRRRRPRGPARRRSPRRASASARR